MSEVVAAEQSLVVVTGGSGFVASYCIANLIAEGWRVRTTVRNLSSAVEVRANLAKIIADPSAIEFVEANLNDDDGWTHAFAGAEYVLHTASPVPAVNPKDDDVLLRPARDGTLRVLKAARACGVKRVVLTSSISAIVFGRGGRSAPFTEADWSDPNNRKDSSAYDRSKTIAERAAWAWQRNEGIDVGLVVVNPGYVIGPVLGHRFSPSILIIKRLLDRSLLGLPRFGFALVDVRDLARLQVLVMTSPIADGHRFIAAGSFLWMSEISAILRSNPGRPRKIVKRSLPDWSIKLFALFDPVLRGRLYELGQKRQVSSEKAFVMLGWRTRPAPESILETARSLVEQRII